MSTDFCVGESCNHGGMSRTWQVALYIVYCTNFVFNDTLHTHFCMLLFPRRYFFHKTGVLSSTLTIKEISQVSRSTSRHCTAPALASSSMHLSLEFIVVRAMQIVLGGVLHFFLSVKTRVHNDQSSPPSNFKSKQRLSLFSLLSPLSLLSSTLPRLTTPPSSLYIYILQYDKTLSE